MDFQTNLTQKQTFTKIGGLSYFADYISCLKAESLVDHIDNSLWDTRLKRRVQHYGWRYDYKARRVDSSAFLGILPDWLEVLAAKLVHDGLFASKPDQVIVNEYLPGQGISAHVDCLPCFGHTIASLSLGSSCVMRFSNGSTRVENYLVDRSLLVFSGEARAKWKHEIPARKSDLIDGQKIARDRRLSLTFRNVNSN